MKAGRGPPWPREHGAYGQLGVPLATAVALAGLSPKALLVAAGAFALFVAHEPLLLLLGQRGERLREAHGARALRWLLLLSLAGAALLVVAALVAPAPTARLMGVPLGLGGAVGLAIARKREKTLLGELLAATALTAWALPTATAGGASARAALECAGTFAAAFAISTVSVRELIASHRPGASVPRLGAVLAFSLLVAAAGLALYAGVDRSVPMALAPLAAVGAAASLVRPHPRRLKQLGWTLVAASLLTGVLLVLGR